MISQLVYHLPPTMKTENPEGVNPQYEEHDKEVEVIDTCKATREVQEKQEKKGAYKKRTYWAQHGEGYPELPRVGFRTFCSFLIFFCSYVT